MRGVTQVKRRGKRGFAGPLFWSNGQWVLTADRIDARGKGASAVLFGAGRKAQKE